MLRRAARKTGLFLLALLLVACVWEAYKAIGPQDGGSVAGVPVLPRANDRAMPHVMSMFGQLDEQAVAGVNTTPVWQVVLESIWYSFRLVVLGFVVGSVVGFALAVLMARFRIAERAVLPYLVISQTVPLLALAPLVVSWGGRVHIGSWEWPRWLSAALLGAFLAFFPVAVGALRGLSSPSPESLQLMKSYASTYRQTLFKLRLPAAVPYLVPALRLAASAAVVGVLVAEISTGLPGGIGRLIIEYAQQITGNPAKVYLAVLGAGLLGLTMAGLITLLELAVMRHRPRPEQAT